MATSGSLLKLETRPCAAPGANANELREAVTASSRRYAQPEDSEASPWLVDQNDLEALLNGLSYRSRTVEELAGRTGLPPDKLAAALRRSEEADDVEQDSGKPGKVRLTPRGSVHLCALQARRNEGEDHVETLTDLVMFLDSRGIATTIPEQVAGVLMPDGQFRWGGAVYNVEVECSTVAKAAEQVVRNVRKAREAGNRVLIALPDSSGVPRLLAVLDGAFPGNRLWPDGIGLVWRDQAGVFHPHRVAGTEVWPFLEEGAVTVRESGPPLEDESEKGGLTDVPADTDPLVAKVREVVARLLAERRTEITSKELLGLLPEPDRSKYGDQRIGAVLAYLGARSRRVWVDGARPRVYDLGQIGEPRLDRADRSGPTD